MTSSLYFEFLTRFYALAAFLPVMAWLIVKNFRYYRDLSRTEKKLARLVRQNDIDLIFRFHPPNPFN